MAGTTHKDLVVWQRGMDLVLQCYELTGTLPSDERFGLIAQMRRAAVSVPANLSRAMLGVRAEHTPITCPSLLDRNRNSKRSSSSVDGSTSVRSQRWIDSRAIFKQ
jgi:hypothetical protein